MARRRARGGASLTVDCGSDDFAQAIHDYMEEHCYDVDDELTEAAGEAAQRAAQLLQQRSRKRKGKGGGRYAKGWVAELVASAEGVEAIVHNKRMPQLTHLLEKGHAIRNQYGAYGGRVAGDGVISQVADEVGGEFEGRFMG